MGDVGISPHHAGYMEPSMWEGGEEVNLCKHLLLMALAILTLKPLPGGKKDLR